MTYYSAIVDEPPALREPYPKGFSAAASFVERKMREAFAEYERPRLAPLASAIVNLLQFEQSEIDVDTVPVDESSVEVALAFAQLLPRALPAPEIGADPDGDVCFDWLGPTGKMFSVSVSRYGRITYAGRFGDANKIHGTEQISNVLPLEIARGIQRAVR